MSLNTDQQAFFKLATTAEPGTKFVLQGAAGTGKTYTVSEIAKHYIDQDKAVAIVAPTHEALNVLRDAFGSLIATGKLEFSTVAKALAKRPLVNEFAEVNFTNGQGLNISDAHLMIVDERSMLSKSDVKQLDRFAGVTIYTGDDAQLRAVMAKANDLEQSTKHVHFKLTQQMRNSSDIEIIANKARDNDGLYFPQSAIKTRVELIDAFMQSDLANSVYICYTNELADMVSQAVRNRLYPNQPAFVVGERLLSRFRTTSVNTNQVFTVLSAEQLTTTDWRLEVAPGEFITTKSPADAKLYRQKLEKAKERALKLREAGNHEGYQQIIDEIFAKAALYADVLYPYARTVHKMQGKSIENVFVDTLDIAMGSDRRRLLYVAYSRAITNLYTIAVPIDVRTTVVRLFKAIATRESAYLPARRGIENWALSKVLGHIAWHCEKPFEQILTDEEYELLEMAYNQ